MYEDKIVLFEDYLYYSNIDWRTPGATEDLACREKIKMYSWPHQEYIIERRESVRPTLL